MVLPDNIAMPVDNTLPLLEKQALPARPVAGRRRQEDRTREARQRLRDAAIAVLIERGYNGLTTKEVITRAGVSNGALMHHYASKMDLVVDATADVYEAATARGERIAATAASGRDPIGGFVRDCTSVYFEWPFLAAVEILVVARTDPGLMEQIQPVMQRYREVTNERWLGVFAKAGISQEKASQVLNLTLNLVRGMAVNRLWQSDQRAQSALLEQWSDIARGMITQA
jgi:AcrR family transcriptional regulator